MSADGENGARALPIAQAPASVAFLRKMVLDRYSSIRAGRRIPLPAGTRLQVPGRLRRTPLLDRPWSWTRATRVSTTHCNARRLPAMASPGRGAHDDSFLGTCPVAPGFRRLRQFGHVIPRRDNGAICSAELPRPELTVSKGVQLQLHFWERKPCYGLNTVLVGAIWEDSHHLVSEI